MNRISKPRNQSDQEVLDQGDQKEHNFYWKCSCWFFQVVDWAMLIVAIIVSLYIKKFTIHIIIAFIVVHIIYILLEIISPISKYLCHKSSSKGMYDNMLRNFRAYPIIHFYGKCYHNEIKYYTTTDKFGKIHQHTKTVQVVTNEPEYKMPYYSERDVSGLFYLNCDRAIIKRKAYIKLKLKEEINFADPISFMDYQNEINAFYANNRYKDDYFDFEEKRYIPGLINHNLIKLGETEPFLANYFFFILFTFLTLSEIYKIYFNSLCIFQRFTVRKIVSTRYDLNQPMYVEKYKPFAPQINLITQTFEYKPEDYNYLNNDYQPNLPTEEEIEQAKKYKDKIPDYKISSGNGSFKQGVIMDNPIYSSLMAKPSNQQPAPAPEIAPIENNINNNINNNMNNNMNNSINTQVNEPENENIQTERPFIVEQGGKFEVGEKEINPPPPNENKNIK